MRQVSTIKLLILDAYGVSMRGGYPRTVGWLAKRSGLPYAKIYACLYAKWFNRAAEGKCSQREAWIQPLRELKISIPWQQVYAYHLAGLKPYYPVLRLAQQLKKRYQVILLSKNTRTQWRDAVVGQGLPRYFDAAINTQRFGLPKASLATMRYLLRRFRVRPGEAVYVDDQEGNLVTAKGMGISTILFKDIRQLKRQLATLGVKWNKKLGTSSIAGTGARKTYGSSAFIDPSSWVKMMD